MPWHRAVKSPLAQALRFNLLLRALPVLSSVLICATFTGRSTWRRVSCIVFDAMYIVVYGVLAVKCAQRPRCFRSVSPHGSIIQVAGRMAPTTLEVAEVVFGNPPPLDMKTPR
ncbi:hypothetical protein LZ30DRAFT_725903 [Colletotrichum cereale]|nr:hypothetical protein LZ30DRAFT_725903 [Colletotrichum cereale]